MVEFKNSLVVLKPGMYILRHPGDAAVSFIVSRGPGIIANSGKFDTLGTPETQCSHLRNEQDCIVAHVYDGEVELLVTACLPDAGRAAPTLRLDKIGLGEKTQQQHSPQAPPNLPTLAELAKSMRTSGPVQAKAGNYEYQAPQLANSAPVLNSPWHPAENISSTLVKGQTFPIPERGISIIGHIETLGDKVALPGDVLCGEPSQDLRLEGFQVNWPDIPDGLQFSYSVRLEGVQNEIRAQLGEFCGTRGQARRIVAISFNLTGLNAYQYKIQGFAAFSGGFRVPLSFGQKIGGPSGFEHLTGLQLEIF